jgi:regulator of protease activity HflC (stomatin/prohibitin superfamily)
VLLTLEVSMTALIIVLGLLGLVAIAFASSARVVRQFERGVVFRLGRVQEPARAPGLTMIVPIADHLRKVSLQIVTMPVPAQEGITRDNVTVRVDAVVYFRVHDPVRAIVEVQDYEFAVSQVAQTSLRSIIGKSELDDLLSNRELLNQGLALMIDSPAVGWGVEIDRVEIKDVELPDSMKRSMSRQAEAERERRARVITADGEFQASQKLASAAAAMADTPAALQLRLLQTIVEVAAEKNSTVVLPFPVELLRFLEQAAGGPGERYGCCNHKRVPLATTGERRTAEDSTHDTGLTTVMGRRWAAAGACGHASPHPRRDHRQILPSLARHLHQGVIRRKPSAPVRGKAAVSGAPFSIRWLGASGCIDMSSSSWPPSGLKSPSHHPLGRARRAYGEAARAPFRCSPPRVTPLGPTSSRGARSNADPEARPAVWLRCIRGASDRCWKQAPGEVCGPEPRRLGRRDEVEQDAGEPGWVVAVRVVAGTGEDLEAAARHPRVRGLPVGQRDHRIPAAPHQQCRDVRSEVELLHRRHALPGRVDDGPQGGKESGPRLPVRERRVAAGDLLDRRRRLQPEPGEEPTDRRSRVAHPTVRYDCQHELGAWQ